MEATRETLRQNKLDSAYIRPLGFVGNVGLVFARLLALKWI